MLPPILLLLEEQVTWWVSVTSVNLRFYSPYFAVIQRWPLKIAGISQPLTPGWRAHQSTGK
jgi:hypothetical protein